jgi:hypothetical protein
MPKSYSTNRTIINKEVKPSETGVSVYKPHRRNTVVAKKRRSIRKNKPHKKNTTKKRKSIQKKRRTKKQTRRNKSNKINSRKRQTKQKRSRMNVYRNKRTKRKQRNKKMTGGSYPIKVSDLINNETKLIAYIPSSDIFYNDNMVRYGNMIELKYLNNEILKLELKNGIQDIKEYKILNILKNLTENNCNSIIDISVPEYLNDEKDIKDTLLQISNKIIDCHIRSYLVLEGGALTDTKPDDDEIVTADDANVTADDAIVTADDDAIVTADDDAIVTADDDEDENKKDDDEVVSSDDEDENKDDDDAIVTVDDDAIITVDDEDENKKDDDDEVVSSDDEDDVSIDDDELVSSDEDDEDDGDDGDDSSEEPSDKTKIESPSEETPSEETPTEDEEQKIETTTPDIVEEEYNKSVNFISNYGEENIKNDIVIKNVNWVDICLGKQKLDQCFENKVFVAITEQGIKMKQDMKDNISKIIEFIYNDKEVAFKNFARAVKFRLSQCSNQNESFFSFLGVKPDYNNHPEECIQGNKDSIIYLSDNYKSLITGDINYPDEISELNKVLYLIYVNERTKLLSKHIMMEMMRKNNQSKNLSELKRLLETILEFDKKYIVEESDELTDDLSGDNLDDLSGDISDDLELYEETTKKVEEVPAKNNDQDINYEENIENIEEYEPVVLTEEQQRIYDEMKTNGMIGGGTMSVEPFYSDFDGKNVRLVDLKESILKGNLR